MEIRLSDYIKNNICVVFNNKLKRKIRNSLNKKEKIEISFKGIDTVISCFINRLIGDLYADYSSKDIDNLISFTNTNKNINELIEIIKKTAKEYYEKKRIYKVL